jgi:predicted transcriptional regulator
MKRTTVVLDDDLLKRLRAIARREEVSLGTVMRQGLEWRAAQGERKPRFISTGRSRKPPQDTGRRAGELDYAPRSWR